MGYSISLNKPHYIFRQNNRHIVGGNGEGEKNCRGDIGMSQLLEEEKLFYENFGDISFSITERQHSIIKYYFGNY